MHWRQRAKQFWLKEGDLNTRFFYSVANGRKKKKKVVRLQRDDGQWVDDASGLGDLVKQYFDNLFAPGSSTYEPVLDAMREVVTVEDNEKLLASFTMEEFRRALFAMNPNKALGPDGFNPNFNQQFWSLVGPDIFQTCNEWLTAVMVPGSINDTNVVLLLKVELSCTMKDLKADIVM